MASSLPAVVLGWGVGAGRTGCAGWAAGRTGSGAGRTGSGVAFGVWARAAKNDDVSVGACAGRSTGDSVRPAMPLAPGLRCGRLTPLRSPASAGPAPNPLRAGDSTNAGSTDGAGGAGG